MFGPFALVAATLFTGAAVYINWAEQPARLGLDDQALLAEWKASYARGFLMQATLAIIGFVLGLLEWLVTADWLWLAGGVALIANWPFTLWAIRPTNMALGRTPIEHAGPETRVLVKEWGKLHAVRSVLGAVSVGLFLWASI
jgi:hypothetical protein